MKALLFWISFLPIAILVLLIEGFFMKNKLLFEISRKLRCYEYWCFDIPKNLYINDPRDKDNYYEVHFNK
jgi:hypothetical protein